MSGNENQCTLAGIAKLTRQDGTDLTTDKETIQNSIVLVAIDLDGTLLTSDGAVTGRNARAIGMACEAGVSVVLATGKSRASASKIIETLELKMPGVFTQGTTIYNAQGKIWAQTTLAQEAAADVLRFAEARSFPYLAYVGERLLMPEESPFRWQMREQYHEPLPEIAGSLLPKVGDLAMNKLVVIDPDDDGAARAALEEMCAGTAHVTQAVPHFIEVLPAGASKGVGLRWLLEQMGVEPARVMAIGDGENDIEMIEMVGLGVAMANAHPRVKAVADVETADNTSSGVAQAIERFVLSSP